MTLVFGGTIQKFSRLGPLSHLQGRLWKDSDYDTFLGRPMPKCKAESGPAGTWSPDLCGLLRGVCLEVGGV